jgi:hypothetical protein
MIYRFLYTYILFCATFFICNTKLLCQHLVINEIQSSNATTIADEDGDYEDWIELYNGTDTAINLAGYYLSDDIDNPMMWAFPNVTIESCEYLLVFASGKDKTDGDFLHTNFSISSDGEPIILSNETGQIIDYFQAVSLSTDISFGRKVDGGLDIVKFYKSTPGHTNSQGVINHDVEFSKRGGIYQTSFSISLSTSDNKLIYYTTNGTIPDANSSLYTGSISLNNSLCSDADIYKIQISPDDILYVPIQDVLKSIIIRAAAFDSLGQRLGKVSTQSYFINELGVDHKNFPILSIAAEHKDLFCDTVGIFVPGTSWDPLNPNWTGNYYQRGQEWERLINVEFYEANNTLAFNQSTGLRTHGGNSRRFQQKGLRLYARSEYGKSTIDYQIFEDKNIYEFKRVVIKPFASSWSQAGIEDFLSNKLAGDLNIDNISTRPTIVYINGEYWGVYYMQERRDKYFLNYNYAVDTDNIDIIYNYYGAVHEGSSDLFHEMYNFFRDNDITVPANYNSAKQLIDIDNFIDYQILQIYIGNYDWPVNNIMLWREKTAGSKWRWIFFDGDAGFGNINHNTLQHALSTSDNHWPTNAHSTLIFRRLMENDEFKTKFFNRLENLLNSKLYKDHMQVYIDDMVQMLENEIEEQSFRFHFPESFTVWDNHINDRYFYLKERACVIENIVQNMFHINMNIPPCNNEIKESEKLFFSIFPNPATDKIIIQLEDSTYVNSISVFDMTGRLIKNISIKEYVNYKLSINCTDFGGGNYIVRITTNNSVGYKKFLII